jgi:chromosome segregation and condensation protein ScpB
MKNNLVLVMIFLSMGTSFGQGVDSKFVSGLTRDCKDFIRDSERVHGDLNEYQLRLQQFEVLVEKGSKGIYGRANAWVKSILFDLGYGLKEFEKLYEHCLCLATKTKDTKVLNVLKVVQDKYQNYSERKLDLIKDIELLRKQVQPFLK